MNRTIKYRKKKNTKRKTKHRRQKRSRGGDVKSMYVKEAVDVKEAESLKTIIDKYIEHFDRPSKEIPIEELPRKMKYDTMMSNASPIQHYSTDIKDKSIDDISTDDAQTMRDIVYVILEDEVDTTSLEYSKTTAGFQNLINNILKTMVNDVATEDTFSMKLRKRISNGIPYLDVVHTKTGLETSYDVNELFAILKNQLKTNGQKQVETIKKTTLRHNRNVDGIPLSDHK